MPVGDDHRPVALGPLSPVLSLDGDRPGAVGRLRVHDLGAEADLLPQPEVVGEFIEVGGHLEVVGVVREVVGHRQGPEGHHPARGVDVQRAVGGRHPVVVFVAPVTADVGALLEAVEGDPVRIQHLGGDDAGAAGADDADLLSRVHSREIYRTGQLASFAGRQEPSRHKKAEGGGPSASLHDSHLKKGSHSAAVLIYPLLRKPDIRRNPHVGVPTSTDAGRSLFGLL